MRKLGDQRLTGRGFPIITFVDLYGKDCSAQASSLAEEVEPGVSAIWLGADDSRMHLSRKQVVALTNHLVEWLESGEFDSEVTK